MNVYKRNENCSLAIKLMKEKFKFSLVGIGGTDLEKGHRMYVFKLFSSRFFFYQKYFVLTN